MRRMWIALVATAILVVTSEAGAQSFQGSLRGTVRDAQGVVSGVRVTMLNEANGVSRVTLTNKVGEFSFPALDAASYTLKAAMAGHKTLVCQAVRVFMATPVRVKLLLEAGSADETITITGQGMVIDTASTGAVVDRRGIDSIPNKDRNILVVGTTPEPKNQ